MTKALSKTQRRARKRQQVDLPELAPITRQKQHRHQGRFARTVEDPMQTALTARCRQSGIPGNDEGKREARAPWWGCEAGKAMASITPASERPALWDAIQHMRKVQAAYDAAIGAPRRHATCLRLLAPQEAFETDASAPPLDTRTDAERLRHATTALMAVEGWLGYVEGRAASVCKRVVIDDERCSDADALCRALLCVSEGISGRRVTSRKKG